MISTALETSELPQSHRSVRILSLPVSIHRMLRFGVDHLLRVPGVWRIKHWLLQPERVRFPEGRTRTPLRFGQRLWVDPNDLIGRFVFYNGLWEGPIATHFYDHLRSGDIVLDVGANIGQYTVIAASKVGPTGRVFAVEPTDHAVSFLNQNIEENGLSNVSILKIAAWNCEATLQMDAGTPGNCGMAKVTTGGQASVNSIPARRLCDVLAASGVSAVDVIKLDIEGSELKALEGLVPMLERSRPRAIYCEFLDDPRGCQALLQFFEMLGYKGQVFSETGLIPFELHMITPGSASTVLFQPAH